jgi:hypothetical protein
VYFPFSILLTGIVSVGLSDKNFATATSSSSSSKGTYNGCISTESE